MKLHFIVDDIQMALASNRMAIICFNVVATQRQFYVPLRDATLA